MDRMTLAWLYRDAEPVAPSYCAGEGYELILARRHNMDSLFIRGSAPLVRDLVGAYEGDVKTCPLTHFNRLILNAYLPFTAPVAFGRANATFGLGDRLGLCAGAHIEAVRRSALKPVLAQQSLRELSFMGRSYDDMLDAASYGVLRAGYRGGYAADGDHLKTPAQIKKALQDDCTMITLDCSDVLRELPPKAPLESFYLALPFEERERLERDYPNDADARRLGLVFNRETLMRLAAQYWDSVALAREVYEDILLPHKRAVDFEISLDETASTTTHEAHYFVARELTRANVPFTSLAPRFVGEFHKAVDYIGDSRTLEADLSAHAKIADHFGHKLSVHSGSDKFSIYPTVARATAGRFHLKTSGTSWLTAVKVIARHEPQLYRRMHEKAMDAFEEAKKTYCVHAALSRIAQLSDTPDDRLADYLEQDDSRQLMHITYGYLFREPLLASDIRTALARHSAALNAEVAAHIGAHVRALGCYKED